MLGKLGIVHFSMAKPQALLGCRCIKMPLKVIKKNILCSFFGVNVKKYSVLEI